MSTKSYWILVAVVICALEACALGFLYGRRDAWIAEFSTPEVRESWDEFREFAKKQTGEAGSGPVKRREPKSKEPPLLVMLRDHFPVVQAATVIFGSAVMIFFAIVVRGITKNSTEQTTCR